MEPFTIEATGKTPTVRFDPTRGQIEIKGRSVPENSLEFYAPLFSAVQSLSPSNERKLSVDIGLDYFNTPSAKCILEFLRKLEERHNKGENINVNWIYSADDDDMKEAGKDYSSLLKLPFNFIPTPM